MKFTGSSPPAPARNSTARLRQPTMAMAGAPRTCQEEQGESQHRGAPFVSGADFILPVFMSIINLSAPQ